MAIRLLSELLAATSKKFPTAAYRSREGYVTLRDLGLVEDAGVVSGVVCRECDDVHSAEVRYCEDRRSYGWHCYEHGFVARDREDLRAFSLNLASLAKLIANALGCERDRRRRAEENPLRVGRFVFADRDIAVYVVFGGVSFDGAAIAQAMAAEPRHYAKLLLTPDLDAVPGLTIEGAHIARLSDAVTIDAHRGIAALDSKVAALAGVYVPEARGRPKKHQPALDDLIAVRIRDGLAHSATRREAQEIREIWRKHGIAQSVPSIDTIRRAIGRFQAVQKGSK